MTGNGGIEVESEHLVERRHPLLAAAVAGGVIHHRRQRRSLGPLAPDHEVAGVHARGMVACFSTDRAIPLRAFREGLNTLLPQDIAVREACEVPLGFNPRRDASGKHYRYTILRDPLRSPLARHIAWRIGGQLDLSAMRAACAHFVGEHDFAGFRASNCAAKTTVRIIYSLELVEDGPWLHLDVNGNGFLKNMVRVMVGTLVEVGQGKRPPEDIVRLLLEGNRQVSGQTAPPHGLCLMRVYYPEESLT